MGIEEKEVPPRKEIPRKGILHTRSRRRRLILQICIAVMVLFALGVFILNDWLSQSIALFSLFWGTIFLLTCLIIILALYDMRRALKEEKSDHNKEMATYMRQLAAEMQEQQEKNKSKTD